MMNRNLLFCKYDLAALIRKYEINIKEEVKSWDRNRILASSESDLVTYLVEKFTLDPPRILSDKKYIEDEGESKVDVRGRFEYGMHDLDRPYYIPGTFITIAIPFDGDGNLFQFKPSTFTFNPPYGVISHSNVLISFQDVKLDADRTRAEIDSTVRQIEQYLEWVRNDCSCWNERVPTEAENSIRHRKNRLLEQANMVSALGLPMKRRPDSDVVCTIPITRKKRPVELPPPPRDAFKPEPALPNSEYEYILNVTDNMSQSIERSPNTFAQMKEEQIRDLILVNLNGHYEGDATGETFNSNGKTDILIRADGRNVSIAECKFWRGSAKFLEAIDQVLSYLTWRDTKTALLLFSKNVNFTDILSSIVATVSEHPNFKRELKKISDTNMRFLFGQKDDCNRDLYLAVQAFNIRN